MPDMPDRLKDYITVAERIEAFQAKYPDGSLQADIVELSENRVVMRAYAYRDRDDAKPGMGYSSMPIPAKNVMLRDSEIETCETSAWGRAIAALGFEVRKGVASRNEIEAKSGVTAATAGLQRNDQDGLVGVIRVGDRQTSDFMRRVDPEDIPHIGFRLEGDKGGILVEASGPLADDVFVSRYDLIGKRVTAYGRIEDRSYEAKDKNGRVTTRTYQALALERLTGPEGLTFPVEPGGPATLADDEADRELDRLFDHASP